jgi:hypothetical protein
MSNKKIKMNWGYPIIIRSILAFIMFFAFTAVVQADRHKSFKGRKKIVLFDGSSTDAWKDIKSDHFPEQGWVVENNILTVLANTEEREGGHDIVTKEQFSNFELELDVRLNEGANSGVKYMVVDNYPGKEGNYLGLEYQLIDNERHADARLGRNGNRRMATLYDILPAREGIKINQPGEWNKVKIIVDKDHVEHWLNGEKAVVYNRESDSFKELVRMSKYNTLQNFGGQERGHILLQGHGNEVSFRNIVITAWEDHVIP